MMQRDSTVVWPTRLIYQCMQASAWIDAFAACQVKSAYFLSEKKKSQVSLLWLRMNRILLYLLLLLE